MPLVVTAEPAPATIQEAKAAGAVEGTLLIAPLAPASGPIHGEAESLVVVTLKNWKDGPVYKTIRNIVVGGASAVALVFFGILIGVWTRGQSIFDAGAIDWRNVERLCEISGGLSIGGAIVAAVSKRNNNPSKQ